MIKQLLISLAAVSLLGSCAVTQPVVEAPPAAAPIVDVPPQAPASPTVIEWRRARDFGAAIQEAKEQGKGVMVLVTATWCGPCKKLKANVLTNPKFAAALANDLIFVKVELTDHSPKGENLRLMRRFQANSFPTYVIIDKELKVVLKRTGSSGSVDAHIQAIKAVLN